MKKFLSTSFTRKSLLVAFLSFDKTNGGGDGIVANLRYYELGPDDPPYAAKFYDCCGAEDPEASGCTTSYHTSYDD
ncbi:hypothetical protein Tsubulata_012000 [Turnera subulata]|uniref:Uncharacterized protein n=1 Tax=Turnera subulata TaxID=218843 RepID=A0A9Q0FF06_9ROSI|nr:hypothetical protein Tsubulata_012000 [Turnera subulata]